MTVLSPTPKMQFFSTAGVPLVGGKLYSYAAGTTTPLATYTSSSGGTANTNPIILDSRGEANVWLTPTSQYKLRLTTSTDVEIWTVDNIDNGWSAPGPIGSVTPNTGAFTTLTTTGSVAVGTSASSTTSLTVAKNITGGTVAFGVQSNGTVQNDVTQTAAGYLSQISTAAGATPTTLVHYYAAQGTLAGTPSAQYGFLVSGPSLIGATNNYSFYAANTSAVTAGKTSYGYYSSINTASGGGTTWAFAANGTAPSYFNGNVGIGTTTPGSDLEITSTSTPTIKITGDATGTTIRQQVFSATASQASIQRFDRAKGSQATPAALVANDVLGYQQWFGYYNSTSAAESFRVQVTADATFSSSTTAPSSMDWRTNPSGVGLTTQMQLSSAGNLGLGRNASSTYKMYVQGDTAAAGAYTFRCDNSANSPLFFLQNDGAINTGTAAQSPYNNTTATAANLFVTSGGTLQRSTSSLRYKHDVQDATHGLTEVLKLRPVTYKGINNGDLVFGGLIAEEVDAAGLTEFVQYDDQNRPDALYYGNMAALLVKAIQEQQAMIEKLKTELAAIKGA